MISRWQSVNCNVVVFNFCNCFWGRFVALVNFVLFSCLVCFVPHQFYSESFFYRSSYHARHSLSVFPFDNCPNRVQQFPTDFCRRLSCCIYIIPFVYTNMKMLQSCLLSFLFISSVIKLFEHILVHCVSTMISIASSFVFPFACNLQSLFCFSSVLLFLFCWFVC